MPAKITRKVLRSGDSKVTALPPDWVRMFRINSGDSLEVLYNTIVIIKPPNLQLNPDFLKEEFALIMQIEEENEKTGVVAVNQTLKKKRDPRMQNRRNIDWAIL